MPGSASKPALAIGEGADARQHDAIGPAHLVRIGGDRDGPPAPASATARSNALAAERRLPEP